MQVFNTIGNVSSVSSVYGILKSELELRSYIYYIQRQDHFFENQQVMVNALSVSNFCHCGYLNDIYMLYTYFL